MTDEEKNKEHLKQQYVGYGYPVEERFLPRVWNGKQYYYPKFSELGLTYENGNGDMMSLTEAFGWLIDTDIVEDAVCFKYVLEACTGLRDKNGRLIYEGDIVKRVHPKPAEVIFDRFHAKFMFDDGDVLDNSLTESYEVKR